MNFKCVVFQTHIPQYDVQGGIPSADRKKIINLSIKYFKKNNPQTYIILSGHGETPLQETIDLCDYVFWEELWDLKDNGYVVDNPAQYYHVMKGVEHATKQGFDYCLVTRPWCLIGLPNVIEYCHDIITKENKSILLTQSTSMKTYEVGDLLMYGKIDVMNGIWSEPVLNNEAGLVNTGMKFYEHFMKKEPPLGLAIEGEDDYMRTPLDRSEWINLLKNNASFRDVYKFMFVDMRFEYKNIFSLGWENVVDTVLDGTFDFYEFLWGRKNGWIEFDNTGNVITNKFSKYYTEKSWLVE